jgi:hypothetical protein
VAPVAPVARVRPGLRAMLLPLAVTVARAARL